MNLEDMLPLRQAFSLDQDDAMLEDDNNQLREQKKPTKWMMNCKPLAELPSLQGDGTHSHARLEGGTLTKRAASCPVSLVRMVVVEVEQLALTANHPKDPTHVMMISKNYIISIM